MKKGGCCFTYLTGCDADDTGSSVACISCGEKGRHHTYCAGQHLMQISGSKQMHNAQTCLKGLCVACVESKANGNTLSENRQSVTAGSQAERWTLHC
eukprot:6185391-Pleurochrysis_carterae.AAC.1